jgi:Na+/H+-dicarboxylate symporter
MRVFSSWGFTRCASLFRTAVLLWIGLFLLCWPSSGSDLSAAFTLAGAPHGEQAAKGTSGHHIAGNYFAVFAAEDESKDKLPRNATLLRTLVFVLFFGTALRWLEVSSWMRRRAEVCSPIRCWFHCVVHLHQRRAVATLLGVFRL